MDSLSSPPLFIFPTMAIGEPSTAFLFVFIGLANQWPYIFCASAFVLNDLPQSKLSNNVFSLTLVVGLAAASITGIGNAILWMAGAESSTHAAIYISLFTFTIARILAQSGMAWWVKRKILRPKNGPAFLFPVISVRMGAFAFASWVFHLVEGILVACVPTTTHLINYSPLYMYIPGFVVHTVLTALVVYNTVYPSTR